MLVALRDKQRVNAAVAKKGPVYFCPACRAPVILRKGRKVIHHYAHKPQLRCGWSAGETWAHQRAKALFYDFFRTQGRIADVEFPLGDSRADVHVLASDGRPVVFEMQHTPIAPEEIARRTQAYFAEGAAVTWLSVTCLRKWAEIPTDRRGIKIDRYTPKPFERWLHGFNQGQVWFVDADTGTLWRGRLRHYMMAVPYSEWYLPGGDKASCGGYARRSKRWQCLDLQGPFTLGDIRFRLRRRPAARLGHYSYPAGWQVRMSPVAA